MGARVSRTSIGVKLHTNCHRSPSPSSHKSFKAQPRNLATGNCPTPPTAQPQTYRNEVAYPGSASASASLGFATIILYTCSSVTPRCRRYGRNFSSTKVYPVPP